MTSLAWLIYLIGFSDTASFAFFWLIIVFFVLDLILGGLAVARAVDGDSVKAISCALIASIIATLICIFAQVVTPNRQTAVYMAASVVSEMPKDKETDQPSLELLQAMFKSETDAKHREMELAEIAHKRKLDTDAIDFKHKLEDNEQSRARDHAKQERFDACIAAGNTSRYCGG